MEKQGNSYTILFTLGAALICALLLSLASQTLKARQELAMEADVMRNILQATGLLGGDEKLCGQGGLSAKQCRDIKCCYEENIRSYLVDRTGAVIKKDGIKAEMVDMAREMEKPYGEGVFPVFTAIKKGKITAYCFPVFGKGLWSSIYGYLALGEDLDTVRGITFHKHGETPGLGGEIQSSPFRESFAGKKIFTARGELVSVTVLKGQVNPKAPEAFHQVDGITGATLTARGVTRLLKKSLQVYEPHIRMIKKGGSRGLR